MRLMVELDTGETVPLATCHFVLRERCGCPQGVTKAGADHSATEEQAWREFYPRKRDQDAAQRRGLSLELMTHARYVAEVMPLMLERTCPHEAVIA